MARKLNYPSQVEPDISPSDLAVQVANYSELRELPDVNTPAEIQERINYFFSWCSRKQVRPTVSLMCLALHRSRQALWMWQQRGGEKGEIIDLAKAQLEALTETWLLTGKTNPVAGIFTLKAQFGYKDVVNIETNVSTHPAAHMTPEQILEQIEQDIPVDQIEENIEVMESPT